ncbi:hypothetical protein [Candidatus Electrothrix sp.]|uniref:hypothetical protein n=1 Tax=Candidatus Electrothrix sp. TaxID=2170559 RepID=UPI004056A5A3
MADITVTIHSIFDLTNSREIRPREKFSFSVTTTNSSEADAVALQDVRYHVKVEDPTIAKILVPPTNPDADGTGYKGVDPASGELVMLAPNTEVEEATLFPRGITKPVDLGENSPVIIEEAGELSVGDSDVVKVYGQALAAGNTQLTCQVSGTPDVAIPLATKPLDIV